MTGHPNPLQVGPLFAILALAAISDLRTRRVPNWLTLGGAVAGFGVNVVIARESGALLSASGWIVGIALLLVPYLFGAMGSGDVKLLGAVGAWAGPSYALATFFYGALVGGISALLLVLGPLLGRWGSVPFRWRRRDDTPHVCTAPSRGRMKQYLAYAPAIALGGLIAFLAGWPGG